MLISVIASSRRRTPPFLYDADAEALLLLLDAALTTPVSEPKRLIIDSWVKREKIKNRWDKIAHAHLPIWGNAVANAICWRRLTSGTFVGGVTHADGYAKGDGSTGYFYRPGYHSNLPNRETSFGSYYLSCLATTNNSQLYGAGSQTRSYTLGRTGVHSSPKLSTAYTYPTTKNTGIFSVRHNATDCFFRRYDGATLAVDASTPRSLNNAMPTSLVLVMGRNNNPTAWAPTQFSNGGWGCYATTDFFDDAEDLDFVTDLRALWQDLTSLTLP